MAIDALDVNHLALGVNAPGVHVNKAAVKRLLWLAANVDLESGMVAEGLAQSLLIGTEEHKRAVEEARWRR